MAQAARAPSSVALRMSPSPVQSPAAATLVSGMAATSFSYSSVSGSNVPATTTLSAPRCRLDAATRCEDDAVGDDPFDGGPHVDGDAQAVEAVHVLGLAFVPDLRRDRLAGFQHGHQTATGGQEFGQLEGDQVTADDDHPCPSGIQALRRHPHRGGSHQPLTPTAHELARSSRSAGPLRTCGSSAPGMLGSTTRPPVATTTASGCRPTTSSAETSWPSSTLAVPRPISSRR